MSNLSANYKKTSNFLVYKCKYHNHIMHQILSEYGKSLGLQKSTKTKVFYQGVCDKIQADWNSFMEFLKSVDYKYCIPKNKFNQRKKKSYSDWWQENNSNGAFAYNNVTDDF